METPEGGCTGASRGQDVGTEKEPQPQPEVVALADVVAVWVLKCIVIISAMKTLGISSSK